MYPIRYLDFRDSCAFRGHVVSRTRPVLSSHRTAATSALASFPNPDPVRRWVHIAFLCSTCLSIMSAHSRRSLASWLRCSKLRSIYCALVSYFLLWKCKLLTASLSSESPTRVTAGSLVSLTAEDTSLSSAVSSSNRCLFFSKTSAELFIKVRQLPVPCSSFVSPSQTWSSPSVIPPSSSEETVADDAF